MNLQFHDNGTLTFNQRKIFRFDEENSNGTEDDMVVIPNIPMLVSTGFIGIYWFLLSLRFVEYTNTRASLIMK